MLLTNIFFLSTSVKPQYYLNYVFNKILTVQNDGHWIWDGYSGDFFLHFTLIFIIHAIYFSQTFQIVEPG